jgi:hypothetical protein
METQLLSCSGLAKEEIVSGLLHLSSIERKEEKLNIANKEHFQVSENMNAPLSPCGRGQRIAVVFAPLLRLTQTFWHPLIQLS